MPLSTAHLVRELLAPSAQSESVAGPDEGGYLESWASQPAPTRMRLYNAALAPKCHISLAQQASGQFLECSASSSDCSLGKVASKGGSDFGAAWNAMTVSRPQRSAALRAAFLNTSSEPLLRNCRGQAFRSPERVAFRSVDDASLERFPGVEFTGQPGLQNQAPGLQHEVQETSFRTEGSSTHESSSEGVAGLEDHHWLMIAGGSTVVLASVAGTAYWYTSRRRGQQQQQQDGSASRGRLIRQAAPSDPATQRSQGAPSSDDGDAERGAGPSRGPPRGSPSTPQRQGRRVHRPDHWHGTDGLPSDQDRRRRRGAASSRSATPPIAVTPPHAARGREASARRPGWHEEDVPGPAAAIAAAATAASPGGASTSPGMRFGSLPSLPGGINNPASPAESDAGAGPVFGSNTVLGESSPQAAAASAHVLTPFAEDVGGSAPTSLALPPRSPSPVSTEGDATPRGTPGRRASMAVAQDARRARHRNVAGYNAYARVRARGEATPPPSEARAGGATMPRAEPGTEGGGGNSSGQQPFMSQGRSSLGLQGGDQSDDDVPWR